MSASAEGISETRTGTKEDLAAAARSGKATEVAKQNPLTICTRFWMPVVPVVQIAFRGRLMSGLPGNRIVAKSAQFFDN